MKDVELTNGTIVRCRSVPPYATVKVRRAESPPPFPREQIKSAAGGVEEVDALDGSPLVQEWQAEMQAYNRRLQDRTVDFTLDFGVVAWKLSGTDAFVSEPPEGWELPETLLAYGVEPSERKRLDYIRYELIANDTDSERINNVLIGDYTVISQEEVESVIDASFPTD
jgi:hypothetical protein